MEHQLQAVESQASIELVRLQNDRRGDKVIRAGSYGNVILFIIDHHNRNNSLDDYFVETKQRNQKKGEVKQAAHPTPKPSKF